LLRPPRPPLFPSTTLFRSLERLGAGDEIGLAIHLDEDADLAAGMDVRADETLGRRAAGFLRRRREAALAEVAHRSVEVAAGAVRDRKSTRLNSSHVAISYA